MSNFEGLHFDIRDDPPANEPLVLSFEEDDPQPPVGPEAWTPPELPQPDFEHVGSLQELRKQTDLQVAHDLRHRLETNPTPTRQELSAGMFYEEVDPQARDALFAIREKGYDVGSIGFRVGSTQGMDGALRIPSATATELAEYGVAVQQRGSYSTVTFEVSDPDLATMKSTWDLIADKLPDNGVPAIVSHTAAAEHMRRRSAAELSLDHLQQVMWSKRLTDAQPLPPPEPRSASIYEPSGVVRQPDYESVGNFQDLRTEAYVQAYHDLDARLATNPRPTAQELSAGAFYEEIEPQVRDAVFGMRAKGYETDSSGFYGDATQGVDGPFSVPEEVAETLRSMGCTVREREGGWTMVSFEADEPDMAAIKSKWSQVVGVLPDLGQPAPDSMSAGSVDMRQAARSGRLDQRRYLENWAAAPGIFRPA